MTRRHALVASAAAMLPVTSMAAEQPRSRRLGLAVYSYSKRWRGQYSHLRLPPFRDALDLLDHVRSLNVAALQVGVQGWTADFAATMRTSCEAYGLDLEGIIDLPRAKGDMPRFERELRIAAAAGAKVFRTALGGRRYEIFTTRAEYQQWREQAHQALALAEPLARRMNVKIGVENHKDFECEELVSALRQIGSPHIGACLDTGNSVALLEHPLEVATALAPFAVTVHLKDMAMREYAEGFQLAEVPLGQGCLPLREMMSVVLQANPEVRFHLEMITRDPLDVPCLTPAYWATFPHKPGQDLARTLTMVRACGDPKLVKVSALGTEAALALEESNVVHSLAFAADKLGARDG